MLSMISVQNHLQLLSGNNKIVLFLLVIGMFTSCAAGKKSGSSNGANVTEIVEPNIVKDTIKKEVIPFDVIEEIKDSVKSEIKEEVKPITSQITPEILKDKYRISVVLPFILKQIPLSGVYVNDTTKQLLPDSKKAMDFYLGCKLAYEEISNYSKKLNVYFLDDNNNPTDLIGLLDGSIFDKSDYIIAPFDNEQVKMLAEFGKVNQKIVLSPTVNSIYITRDNPYYYSVNPTLNSQYQFILDKIKDATPNTTIEVVYSSTDSISENISLLKNIIAQNIKSGSNVNIQYYDLISTTNVAQQLYSKDTISKRVVLLYSSNLNYIKPILNQMGSIKNPLDIYTNSSVRYSKNLVTTKNFKQRIYCPAAYDANNDQTKIFKQKYIDKFIKEPTELSYLGYDLMKLLFYKIDKNETLQTNSTSIYNEFIQQDFNFVPINNTKGELQYYDNAYLNMLHFSNGAFVK